MFFLEYTIMNKECAQKVLRWCKNKTYKQLENRCKNNKNQGSRAFALTNYTALWVLNHTVLCYMH